VSRDASDFCRYVTNDSSEAVWLRDDRGPRDNQPSHQGGDEVSALQPGYIEHHHGGEHQNDGGTEVGDHYHPGEHHEGNQRRHERIPVVDRSHPLGDEPRQEHNKSGLGELRRLQSMASDAQPAVPARVGEVHDHEERNHHS
jgi:hypothetical protein